ncbi:MAG: TolB family protein, partial [Desulfococcaceae bacterium]
GIKSIQMYDWSPDGTHISYTAEIVTNASGEDRVSYLAVVEDVYPDEEDPSGTPVVLSRNNTLGDRGPVFSPDSQRVAFWSWDKNYRATLWMANRDGTNITQLTQKGFDMYPRWRPDGTGLLFESNRAGNMDIWTMELP